MNKFLLVFSAFLLSFQFTNTFAAGQSAVSFDGFNTATVLQLADGTEAIFLNGKQYFSGKFQPDSLSFLSDGNLSFAETEGDKTRLVIGKEKGEWCDSYPYITDLTSSKNWAYTCKQGEKYFVFFKSGKKYGPSDSEIYLYTSRDQDRFLFSISKDENYYLVTSEGKEIRPGTDETLGQYGFYGKNGNSILYTLRKNNKERLVINGKQGPEFDSIEMLTYSSTSSSYAYFGLNGDSRVLIHNGRQIAKDIEAWSTLYLHTDNKLISAYKIGGTWNVIFRGKLYPRIETSEANLYLQVNDSGDIWSAFATKNGVPGIYFLGKWIPKE